MTKNDIEDAIGFSVLGVLVVVVVVGLVFGVLM